MVFMSPDQAAVVFARFTAAVRDLDDPEDQELARIVLYPDGSGGIVWEPEPNTAKWRVPPTEMDVQWHSADDAIGQLGAGSPTATDSTNHGNEAIASLTVQWLVIRDERERLKGERKALVCTRKRRPEACWQLELAAPCRECARNQEVQRRLDSIHGQCARLVRSIRQHATEAGYLGGGRDPAEVVPTPTPKRPRGRPRKVVAP